MHTPVTTSGDWDCLGPDASGVLSGAASYFWLSILYIRSKIAAFLLLQILLAMYLSTALKLSKQITSFCMHRCVQRGPVKPFNTLPGFCWISMHQVPTGVPPYAESLHSWGQVQWLVVFSSSDTHISNTSSGIVLYTVDFHFIDITVCPQLSGELPSFLSSCMIDGAAKKLSFSNERSKIMILKVFWGSSRFLSMK